jgi:hypothetical protein
MRTGGIQPGARLLLAACLTAPAAATSAPNEAARPLGGVPVDRRLAMMENEDDRE